MKATGPAVDDIAPTHCAGGCSAPAGDEPEAEPRPRAEQSRSSGQAKWQVGVGVPARGLPLLETFSRVIRATGRWDLSRGPVCQTMTTSCLDSGADHARETFFYSAARRSGWLRSDVASTATEYAQDPLPAWSTTPQYLLHKSLVTFCACGMCTKARCVDNASTRVVRRVGD